MSVADEDRSRTRSLVASQAGVVASESVLASQVGARILESGGNAVDAAVAANAVLGLVAPMNDGIGGDLFAIIYEAASGRLHGLNASGWAPAALSAEYLRSQGMAEMPQQGIHSVTVPGVVAGWSALLGRCGSRDFAQLLAPAIRYAEDGFPLEEVVQGYWHASEPVLRADSAAARTYLPGGRVPSVGELFRNPELAWSYRQIAAAGRDAFYEGEVAQRILATSAAHAGRLRPDDLADYEAEWIEPISTGYRGWTICELPPNGQGIAALEMLNIMEQFPLAEWGHNSVRALHTMIEAKKLAYADLMRHVGDTRFASIPVATLASKAFAAERARSIDPARAAGSVSSGAIPGTDHGTTYLAVADRAGNMVSLIQSNFMAVGFGSGLAVEGAGFVLQNRGGLFTLAAGHPNVLAGRKRSLHTIIPGFMHKGDTRIAFGVMGGWNQAQAHAQFVSNVVDFGLNIQAALDAPRFSKDTFDGRDVNLEARIPAGIRRQLGDMGHDVLRRGDYSSVRMGAGQAVAWDPVRKVMFGASDARKDGAAIAALLPWE
ncbi:MAG TPA: gamma-glutamyltransferase [Steroidobacteraceae bacterium]|jgi:gamma-glutamyltranspeptidase/glutathione hydrolase|nr:gamma-glutamyltransferase [Steroidobacteraceae bacterium]